MARLNEQTLDRFLVDVNQDREMAKDHSVIIARYEYSPSLYDVKRADLYNMIISKRGAGLTSITDIDQFGDQSALAKGISIYIERDGVVFKDLTDGNPIKRNGDWAEHTAEITDLPIYQFGFRFSVNWIFNTPNIPERLIGNDKLVVEINDNLSTINSLTFKVNGIEFLEWN